MNYNDEPKQLTIAGTILWAVVVAVWLFVICDSVIQFIEEMF